MKNKKGFTVVELIVSFSLAMAIAVFLLQMVIVLKNLYTDSGMKTELLNKQSLISNQINSAFIDKEIQFITKCGSYCINFLYDDSTSERLVINYEENTIQFGSYITSLPMNSYFDDVLIDIVYSGVFQSNHDNAILNLHIPVYNDSFPDQNYGVNIVYPFNSNYSNIYAVSFDSQENDYGYISLLGSQNMSVPYDEEYVEPGYKIYDSEGVELSGTVEIENPLQGETLPYTEGVYEIKYNLKSGDNIIYTTTRKVTVVNKIYLSLNDSSTMHVDLNSSFTDPGVVIKSEFGDNTYTAGTNGITLSYNTISTSSLGIKTITYILSKDGVEVDRATRQVYVEQEYQIQLDYTGGIQELTLPVTTTYTIELWGGQGGNSTYGSYTATGGLGGYSKANYSGSASSVLYFTIGGKGTNGTSTGTYSGGFNGGGNGYYYGAGGGGATDVRRASLATNSTTYRILVAGGGGGAVAYNSSSYLANGGTGGGANQAGGNGNYITNWNVNKPGLGGLVGSYQTNAMNTIYYNYGMVLGSHLYGGNASSPNGSPYTYAGGGGGGYFGGTSGGYNGTSGGGGSGYANSSYLSSISGSSGVNQGNGKAIITFKYHGDVPGYYVRDMPTTELHYTGGQQTYTTSSTADYYIELWGAQGGNANYGNSTSYPIVEGGRGGYVAGYRNIAASTSLYVNLGGSGTFGYSSTSYAGGYNGGGTGYYYSGGGGGASHIATSTGTLSTLSGSKTTIYMVAGGGGGATSYTSETAGTGGYGGSDGTGGYGGYHTAVNSSNSSSYRGQPGTISSSPKTGMYSTSYNSTTYLGTFGVGGGSTVYTYTGGGGAGYYGGSQGGYSGSGGGGGSGYVTGFTSAVSASGVKQGNGEARIICMTCNDKKFISLSDQDFDYVGTVQQYFVPITGRYKLEVWGAQGGYRSSATYSGKGGYSYGTVSLSKGTILYVYVGGSGNSGTCTSSICRGGYNGGGYRHTYKGGGGATDIRFVGGSWNNSTSLLSRLIVAGGGGSDGATAKQGMYGGGTAGGSSTESYSGDGNYCGKGGTATYSGYSTSSNASAQATSGLTSNSTAYYYGGFGFGGGGIYLYNGYGGAGGGGWYGGSGTVPDGSVDDDRGGGGGSGFVWTSSTAANVPSGYSVSTSYYLTDAATVAGNTSFSNPSGTSETGHSGNGYARITYLGS